MSQTSQLGVNLTLIRFIQQRAAAALMAHHRPRILLCAPAHFSERLAASTQYQFIPCEAADARILREIRKHPFDGVLIHYELGIGNNSVLEFMDVAGEEFRKLPCFVLCKEDDPKEISRHGWRSIGLSDLSSASELEEKLKLELFLFPWMRRDALRNNLAILKIVPPWASRHQHVVRRLRSSQFNLEEAAEFIKRDPVLSAQLLHLAGAAPFSRGKPVENADKAVSIFGAEQLKSLLASAWVFFTNYNYACEGFDPKAEWIHAVEVADQVRKICEYERVDARTTETAITAAFLHDFGKLLLAAKRPNDYAKVLAAVKKGQGPSWQVEDQLLGFNHAEVAGCLLALWGAPLPVAEEVMLHHSDGLEVWSPAYLIQRVHPKHADHFRKNKASAEDADMWGDH